MKIINFVIWEKNGSDYKIKFVSDVDLHEDYGQDQTRFTLLKKL